MSKLDKETGEVQVNLLLYAMGRYNEPIYNAFHLSDEDAFDYDTVSLGLPRTNKSEIIL